MLKPAGYLALALAGFAAPVQAAPATQCKPSETIAFSCQYGSKTVSVCLASGKVIYRAGKIGAPEMDIVSNGKDGRAFSSSVTGQGGGGQTSLRFIKGDYSYLVSSGITGSLADKPGTRWSVLTVMKGQAQVAAHDCKATTHPDGITSVVLPDDPDERIFVSVGAASVSRP